LMDELRRVLNQGNSHFLTELKTRKALNCHDEGFTREVPITYGPTQELRHASEAVLHVLE
ncbi:hypothetical protein KUCAC02_020379, partial [Chaenocephalus aceratus]